MSEMIERVAEAIRLRSCERGYPVHHAVAHHLAAAAIAAMREPTANVVAAHHVVPDDNDFKERAADNWRNLIDAALK